MESQLAHLHQHCTRSWNDLCHSLNTHDGDLETEFQDEYDRYQIWAGNVGAAHHGATWRYSLDYRLRESSVLKDQVSSFLGIIQNNLRMAIGLLENGADDTEHSSYEEVDDDSSWGLSSEGGSSDDDAASMPLGAAVPSQDANRTFKSHSPGLNQRLLIVRKAIHCLYKLPIRYPAPIDRLGDKSVDHTAPFHAFDLLYVRDKFPKLQSDVSAHLAKMMTRRRQLLLYRRTHQDRISSKSAQSQPNPPSQATVRKNPPKTDAGESEHRTLQSKATTAKPMPVDSHETAAPPVERQYEAPTSIAASEPTRELKLAIPPRPRDKKTKKPLSYFECPYCCIPVTIISDREWKKHVIADILPYVCTHQDCQMSDHFFPSRTAWYLHEIQSHRMVYVCGDDSHDTYQSETGFREHMKDLHNAPATEFLGVLSNFHRPSATSSGICNLCQTSTSSLQRHVARHLEQLALFAIPRIDYAIDEDDHLRNNALSNGAVNSQVSSRSKTPFQEHSTSSSTDSSKQLSETADFETRVIPPGDASDDYDLRGFKLHVDPRGSVNVEELRVSQEELVARLQTDATAYYEETLTLGQRNEATLYQDAIDRLVLRLMLEEEGSTVRWNVARRFPNNAFDDDGRQSMEVILERSSLRAANDIYGPDDIPETVDTSWNRVSTRYHDAPPLDPEVAQHELVESLRASSNAIDIHGGPWCNVLWSAAEDGNTEVVKLILQRSTNLDVRSKSIAKAIDIATANGFVHIVEMMREAYKGSARDREARQRSILPNVVRREDYHIAWVCGLPLELASGACCLDVMHSQLPRRAGDDTLYKLGSIGPHNVVIACLPGGSYGVGAVATLLHNMQGTFPQIQHILMVGIGSGAPSDLHDIRLGDIVVSQPTRTSSGMVQYNFGEAMAEDGYIQTVAVGSTTPKFAEALSKLQIMHSEYGYDIRASFEKQVQRYPRRASACRRPVQDNDKLFFPGYTHVSEKDDCSSCDPQAEVMREPRTEDKPIIHHGVIASGDRVVKDGIERERIRNKLDALCIDFGVAGLTVDLPGLVVRGICDYADSHRNGKWREYAAAVAAAYTRELLELVPAAPAQRLATADDTG